MKKFALMIFLVLLWSAGAMAWTRTDACSTLTTGDDGRLVGTTFGTGETSNYWGRFTDGNQLSAFFRVMSKVPAGRIIDSVVVIPQAYSISGTDTSYIRLSSENNPSAPTSTATWNAITKTADSVQWIGGGTWTTGTRYRSPKITALFQETYNAGECDSGEYFIVFMLGRNLSNSVDAYRRTLDIGFSGSYNFIVEITHSSPPAADTGGRLRRMKQLGSLEPQFIEWTKWERVQ